MGACGKNSVATRGADGRPLETTSGKFGPQTEHALRAFQADHGLKVDGEYGDRSRAALAASTREAARDPAAASALPQASDLALLAVRAWQRGEAIAADLLEPAYLRDKVALTLAEQGKPRPA